MEKAQKGDLIRIVKPFEYAGDPYEIGDILEVTRRRNVPDGSDVYALFNGVEEIVADCEYVIHRKAGEEDSEECRPAREFLAELREEQAQDAVNSPNHYTQGKFETIEIIEEITKGYSDGYVAYCVGNALKYLARAPFKHGEPSEDLSKAAKYLAFANEYLGAKSTRD